MILGHGVDLAPVERIGEMVDEHGERFLRRVFTSVEREYADARPKRRLEHLAVRFAAKEAALKALGTGWRDGIAWTDVEVLHAPSGQPVLNVTGRAAEIAASLGVSRWVVSLSHAGGVAVASVIALRGD